MRVFASDVEALELIDGSMEKCVKVKTQARYIISNGIKRPFKITAEFVPKDTKLEIVNSWCASCSGQGAQATQHRERMLELVNEFKPGLMSPDGERPVLVDVPKEVSAEDESIFNHAGLV